MIVVTPAAPADIPAAAAVLAEAFEHDPALAPVVGGPDGPTRRERVRRMFTGLMRSGPARAGTVDVARRAGSAQILGVAVWEEPGATTGLLAHLAQLPTFWRVDGLAGLLRQAAAKRALEAHRPRQPHWYLQEIGVGADARGLGVGTALLAARLAAADAEDAPAYLESSTPRNRRLYGRHGFLEVAPVRGMPGAVPMAMWRPAPSGRVADQA